jgi:hypothetical protein
MSLLAMLIDIQDRRVNRFITVAVAMAALGSAQATYVYGPPYTTDDPEPVDFHHWEVYVASMWSHTAGFSSGTFPHFEVNYGAAPNLQLHAIAPLAYAQPLGGPNQYGYGDTELGVKYRFIQETSSRPMVGVFPLVEVPTGAPSKGLGNGEAQVFLPVWIQKSFGSWSSYGGGGYWHNPGSGNRDYWLFGWQAQKQATKQLSIGAELLYNTAKTVDTSSGASFNVGAVYDFDEGHHLLASIGKGFTKDNLGTAYLAFQWTFGPHEKKAAE